MTERDKLIAELQLCVDDWNSCIVSRDTIIAVIDMLKAQEPRGQKLVKTLRHISNMVALGESVMELPSCVECALLCECEYAPKSGPVRLNCPLWQGEGEKMNDGDRR